MMATKFPTDLNGDVACCQVDMRITEKTEDASVYPKGIEQVSNLAGAVDQLELISIKKKLQPLTKLEKPELETSAIASLEYLTKPPVSQAYDVSRDAEEFISRQRKRVIYRKDLIAISDRVSEFLKKEGMEAKISISLFTDPEYSDWSETKIKIEVPKEEFERAYGMYNELLQHSLKGVRRKTLEKVVVSVESR